MVKQNTITMKQPELGQRILEWRKAKGLTQEELVERCNINVRTIQRIEAGEVTPRAYTIKTILEVLEVKPEDIPLEPGNEDKKATTQTSQWLQWAYIAGIVYLIFVVVESVIDVYIFFENPKLSTALGYAYTFIKLSVIALSVVFLGGFYKLGDKLDQPMLKVIAVLLIFLIAAFSIEDVASYWLKSDLILSLILRSVVSGIVYLFFAIPLLQLSKTRGSVYLIAGALGILTGISFLSVIFALPGLVLLTIFEIVLVVLLYKEYTAKIPLKTFSVSPPHQVFN